MLSRLRKEVQALTTEPGPGIAAWQIGVDYQNLEAQIQGPDDSPFAGGLFSLAIHIPNRYPFEPPLIRFITPIYHPNIDRDGRICLDVLKMQPQGSWSPSININTVLLSIRLLMQAPNGSDGLVPEITEEFNRDPVEWRRKAVDHTSRCAQLQVGSTASSNSEINETQGTRSDTVDTPSSMPVQNIADTIYGGETAGDSSEGPLLEQDSDSEGEYEELPWKRARS